MESLHKSKLTSQVIAAIGEYGANISHFRQAMNAYAGLTGTEMVCLQLLFLEKVASPTQIAQATGLTSGATTTLLDRLEVAGLIQRSPNTHDRRGTLIRATQEASNRARGWYAPTREAQLELIAQLPEEKLLVILEFLQQLSALWASETKRLQNKGSQNNLAW